MRSDTSHSQRRKTSLSTERVVAAAIDILDSAGESAMTFRALANQLSTGSGAIYWHVADKDALLSLATEHVLSRAIARVVSAPCPADALRAIALGVFDAIEAHPWVGTQLAREPWQPAMVEIFEKSSAQFNALGVSSEAIFHCVSALAQYLLGTAAQTAAAARHKFCASDRSTVLTTIVGEWTKRDPAEYPFVHLLADQVRSHDERAAFLAGLNLIIAGSEALTATKRSHRTLPAEPR
ncbi:TetR/AcrR family transcriptional regulator [Sphingomonas sp. S2-65]|uniref:TetR/AcrR family transcriptional regulator n=1 Tax=Sphingomonas sp. S2-65 TaxID=2903960 RepID=UPI001F47D9BB|nr:TetR/AcrR family transcriptional regulator C-terminal domain-containing protein [Sphingomonas sp. S2-65]UYY57145.1 TetR/AcrR family transcriptional regulator C-terminal domain-containing protein [Sphingomonas sp. S2-65]